MPQMAPISWIFMFLLFTMMFSFLMTKMFFFQNNMSSPQAPTHKMNLLLNPWKW